MKESLENSHPDNHHLVRASTEELSHLPASWYFFCLSKDLTNSPLSKECFGKRLVAYRKGDGQPVVMDAHCSHMGADLGKGRVLDDALQCPLHHWEYGPNGCCRHIPATDVIPHFARQTCFPAQERVGILFVFNGVEASFPLPFFSSAIPEELCAAKPFSIELNCPWYTVGANHFDLQHFRAAHDRVPIGEYRIDCPEPYARRASCCFQVAGTSLRDRLTRCFAGDRVTMTIVDWCGTLMFVTAEFPNTTSYGLVNVIPTGQTSVRVVVTVFVRKVRGVPGGKIIDSFRAYIRRYFVKTFLESDFQVLSSVEYDRGHYIDCDDELAEYFRWLKSTTSATTIKKD